MNQDTETIVDYLASVEYSKDTRSLSLFNGGHSTTFGFWFKPWTGQINGTINTAPGTRIRADATAILHNTQIFKRNIFRMWKSGFELFNY